MSLTHSGFSASLLLLLAALCSTAFTQASLTLDECLQLAQKNSPALSAAEGAIRSSEIAHQELSTSALPQLKGVAGASYAPVPPRFGYDPALSNGGQLAGQVVLQQSVYDGGMRSIKADQLQQDADRLKKERQRTQRDLTYAVKQSFIEGLRAQLEVELQNQSEQQLTDYLGLVQRLYHGGNASYTDVLKTEVQLSTARLALQKSVEVLNNAKYALTELTSTTIDSCVTFAGDLDSLMAVPVSVNETRITNNLDLSISDFNISRSLLDVELTRRERFPAIMFVADAGYLSSIENLRLPTAERLNTFGYSVGLGVELPIFNWGATGFRVEQKELETESLRLQRELLQRSVRTEYQKTRMQLTNAKERLRAIQGNISKAEENYLLTKSKFAGGVSLSLEVLAAQQLLTESKLSQLQTLTDIQLLAAKLEQLLTQ
jgi:outer membrane protein TolC